MSFRVLWPCKGGKRSDTQKCVSGSVLMNKRTVINIPESIFFKMKGMTAKSSGGKSEISPNMNHLV